MQELTSTNTFITLKIHWIFQMKKEVACVWIFLSESSTEYIIQYHNTQYNVESVSLIKVHTFWT